MLLTWRWTVLSARCSRVAMAWLVAPAATRRSTSSSRPVSPPVAGPGPGRLVGHLQLAPGPPGAAQGGHGGAGVALGQAHRPHGVVGRRPQGLGPVVAGDL